jgi:hypothetical protein
MNQKKGIIANPIIIYTSGITEKYEAIRKSDKGVIIGRILDDEFIECGFISKKVIKEIITEQQK